VIQRPSIRRALVMSAVLHALTAAVAWWAIVPARVADTELVDIEVAPAPPAPEALPPEVAKPPAQDLAAHDPKEPEAEPASTAPPQPGDGPIDAGLDAPIDAGPDAAIDARPDARPDAAIDARPDAAIDAAPDGPPDAGVPDDGAPLEDGPGNPGSVSDAMTVASNAADADEGDAGVEVAATGSGHDAGDEPAQVAAGDGHDGGAGPAQVAITDAGHDPGDEAVRVAIADAGHDAVQVAIADAGHDAVQVAIGKGSGPGSGASTGSGAAAGSGASSDSGGPALDTTALAAALARGSGAPGTADEPAVDGAPTTAGTAANLLAYFPDGHVVTALIRFDRLRGTEWSAQAERLLRPMPDYQLLFGAHDAAITDKLETLVISTPRPRDAASTTLVARTQLTRGALRGFLGATTPVTWSAARGGLLGKRTGKLFAGDRRVFLSPFKGWFLLAQPEDLGRLTAAAKGNLDAVEATAKLPPWLAGIRTIETETGEPRGPAAVVTLGLDGKRLPLGGNDLGLGIPSIPTPERVSLAMELVKQGWLVRGNMRFASEADATELVAAVQRFQQRIADSHAIQLVIGKPIARVVANLAFARAGPRVSYATSISIADARAILAVAALQLDQYFGRAP
jgi:hypothetical protein